MQHGVFAVFVLAQMRFEARHQLAVRVDAQRRERVDEPSRVAVDHRDLCQPALRSSAFHVQDDVERGGELAVGRLAGQAGGEADVGVLGEIPAGSDFQVVRLNSTPIIAFASRNHPAARLRRMSFEELLRFPLVLREEGSKTRKKLEEGAARAGVKLPPSIEAEGREAVREIVAAGAGIGFVSRAEFGEDPRLVPIGIKGPVMLMDEALICLKARSRGTLVRAFLNIASGIAARK